MFSFEHLTPSREPPSYEEVKQILNVFAYFTTPDGESRKLCCTQDGKICSEYTGLWRKMCMITHYLASWVHLESEWKRNPRSLIYVADRLSTFFEPAHLFSVINPKKEMDKLVQLSIKIEEAIQGFAIFQKKYPNKASLELVETQLKLIKYNVDRYTIHCQKEVENILEENSLLREQIIALGHLLQNNENARLKQNILELQQLLEKESEETDYYSD